MEDICKALQNIVIERYEISKYYKVTVTFINNPHSFYVRPIDLTYLKILEKCGKPAQTADLFPGASIVYRSQTSNKFVRGSIIGLNKSVNQTFDVFAIDYGYFDNSVDIKAILKPETSTVVPPLARHCRLANCAPVGATFTNDVTETMKTYVDNEYCLMYVDGFQMDQIIVKLYNSCHDDIASMLCLTHYTNFGIGTNIPISKMESIQPSIPKFCLKSLKVNDVLNVRFLRAKSLLPNTYYVATIDDYKKYIKNRNSLTEYCQYQKVLTRECLEVGKCVAYKDHHESHYERAVIKSITETGYKALISLIDAGGTTEAVLQQMKEIKCLQHFDTPGIAFQCTFEDIVEDAKKLPENIIPGYEILIKIKEIGDPNIVEHSIL